MTKKYTKTTVSVAHSTVGAEVANIGVCVFLYFLVALIKWMPFMHSLKVSFE
jgi:hypothetical protein